MNKAGDFLNMVAILSDAAAMATRCAIICNGHPEIGEKYDLQLTRLRTNSRIMTYELTDLSDNMKKDLETLVQKQCGTQR